jgi:hypothetical protein
MDDDYIEELLRWVHPHIANAEPIQYTEKEELQLLSLPKKECLSFALLFENRTDIMARRSHNIRPDSRPLPDPGNSFVCVRI